MEHPGEAHDALHEAVVFLSHFKDLPDPRQSGKVTYPLDEILLLCLLAVLAGAETITDIARFGEKKLDLLRRFRPFADARSPWRYPGHAGRRGVPALLRRLGGIDHRHRCRSDRH